MITFTINDLDTKAKIRPKGYVEYVLSKAVRAGDVLQIEDAEWQALRIKYAGQLAVVTIPSMPIEKIRERFEICKACDRTIEGGVKCARITLKNCTSNCFDRWRANPENNCPLGKWPASSIEIPPAMAGSAKDRK